MQCHCRHRKFLPEFLAWNFYPEIVILKFDPEILWEILTNPDDHLGWVATLAATRPDMGDVHQKWRVVQVLNLHISLIITMEIRCRWWEGSDEVRNTSSVGRLCSRVRKQTKEKIGRKRRRPLVSGREKAILGANILDLDCNIGLFNQSDQVRNATGIVMLSNL